MKARSNLRGSKKALVLSVAIAALAFPAAVRSQEDTPTNADAGDPAVLAQDAANWPMAARDYSSTRYSELDQINTDNVANLRLAWAFSLGADHGQEAAPIVVDGTMYVVGPYPNQVFALDAATGELKWTFSPPVDAAAQGVACCDVINRGAAYADGKVIFNTLDDSTVALDARTGEVIWHTQLGDFTRGETMTMAPLIVRNHVLVGNAGGEFGIRGWLASLDLDTGAIQWRAYSTGPDSDVLIGDDFAPYYDWMKGDDLGVTTWPADRWQTGGGTAWGWLSYDPDLNLLYYGTSNPGPWNAEQRPGDNLWTATVFARDPDTGDAKWAYQPVPHDLFDHDAVNESILVDLQIDGSLRQVMLRPERNGFMYVIDRATGQVLSADKYDDVNTVDHIDLTTGRPVRNEDMIPTAGQTLEDVCPAFVGVKDWQPSAWSPQTQLLYVPHQHLCMNFQPGEVGYIAGTPFVGATVDTFSGQGGYRGAFSAWDPVSRREVWSIHENFPVWSGTMVTAGNVVFYGTMDRLFKAVDARTGDLLWEMRVPSGIIGQPTTFLGSDGVQYVAILCGVGGQAGALAHAEIDPRVRNAQGGLVGAMQDLPAYTRGGATLMVFALPQNTGAPAPNPPAPSP